MFPTSYDQFYKRASLGIADFKAQIETEQTLQSVVVTFLLDPERGGINFKFVLWNISQRKSNAG